MPIGRIGRKKTGKVYLALAAAGAVASAFPAISHADIELSQLIAAFPTLNFTGSGVNVAQVEADGGNVSNEFEVNPATVSQPASLFTYIDDSGNVSNTFNPVDESGHSDTVGNNFYGGAGVGVAPGVAHVDNYSANSFYGGLIATGTNAQQPTLNHDTVISESYAFLYSGTNALSTQQTLDLQYDEYIINFPSTIMVNAAGAGAGPVAPGTAYNSISVNPDGGGGNQVTGPTPDGRDKPDIEAFPTTGGEDTSYATPMVSGAAAILVQAGARGDGGGVSTEANAVDPRVVKALLMNGAVKGAGWSTGVTPTSPLNATAGAGDLNIYNSYLNLRGGEHTFGYTDTQPAVSNTATPTLPVGSLPMETPIGWNLTSVTTSSANSDLQHYLFNPVGIGTTTFTATANWWRNPMLTHATISNPINNIFMFLYDDTISSFLTSSISTVDNVQEIYATGVNAADKLDLIVMKKGGTQGSAGVVSNLDTYALAWDEAPLIGIWQNPSGGSWAGALNWSANTMPNGPGGSANFNFALTSPQTVTLDGNVTIGSMEFNNVNFYTIAQGTGGALTLDNSNVQASISVNNGNQTISAPVNLTAYGVDVSPVASASLTFAGTIAGTGPLAVENWGAVQLAASNTFTGGITTGWKCSVIAETAGSLPTGRPIANAGSLVVNANNSIGTLTGAGTLTVNTGATLQLALGSGPSTQSGLTLNGTGSLDINDNTVVINYGTNNTSPVGIIGAYIAAGYNGATFAGPGIISSKVASVNAVHGNAHLYAIGYADASDPAVAVDGFTPGTVVIKPAIVGDANLDGKVNFTDFQLLAASFNGVGTSWDQGNFDFSAKTDFTDFQLLAANFNDSTTLDNAEFNSMDQLALSGGFSMTANADGTGFTLTSVPEPVSVGMAGLAAFGLLGRRRSRKTR